MSRLFGTDNDNMLPLWHYSISEKSVFLIGPIQKIEKHIHWIGVNTRFSPKFKGININGYGIGFAIST